MYTTIALLALVGWVAANPVLLNPNALPVPLDEPITALAKNAQLIQQHTEGTRNILGGGIPLALPADTPEVAAGKQAHAIAHANQVAATSGHASLIAAAPAAIASPWATHAAIASPVIAARAIATPWAASTWAAGPLGLAGPVSDGHLTWLSRRRRSVALVNPNALPVPLDEPITALAKNAQLIQQHTEGTRNILGGGIPLALPADTPEVAAGKQAHAIAHANQVAATSGHSTLIAAAPAAIASPWATHASITSPVIADRAIATPWAAAPWTANTWAAGPLGFAGPLSNGHLAWLSRRRRSVALVNPNALPVPLDEPITALAKNAQLIQQQTEGTRNILGGGIPLALPADTPEVAAGKQAHAIAHANQVAATSGHSTLFASAPAVIASSWATHAAIASPVIAARTIATPWAAAPWTANTWAAAPLGLTRTHWW